MLAMVYQANETNTMAVKTPNGLTEANTMNKKIVKLDVNVYLARAERGLFTN